MLIVHNFSKQYDQTINFMIIRNLPITLLKRWLIFLVVYYRFYHVQVKIITILRCVALIKSNEINIQHMFSTMKGEQEDARVLVSNVNEGTKAARMIREIALPELNHFYADAMFLVFQLSTSGHARQ